MLAFDGAAPIAQPALRRARTWDDMQRAIEEERRNNPGAVVIAFYFVKGGAMPVYSSPIKRDLKFWPISLPAGGTDTITAGQADAYDVFLIDPSAASGATCEINLPANPPSGTTLTISMTAAPGGSASGLSVVAGGTNTIDGQPIVLTVVHEQITLVFEPTDGIWLQI